MCGNLMERYVDKIYRKLLKDRVLVIVLHPNTINFSTPAKNRLFQCFQGIWLRLVEMRGEEVSGAVLMIFAMNIPDVPEFFG